MSAIHINLRLQFLPFLENCCHRHRFWRPWQCPWHLIPVTLSVALSVTHWMLWHLQLEHWTLSLSARVTIYLSADNLNMTLSAVHTGSVSITLKSPFGCSAAIHLLPSVFSWFCELYSVVRYILSFLLSLFCSSPNSNNLFPTCT